MRRAHSMHARPSGRPHRRAVVLLMSLVVITIGALIATTILYFSSAPSYTSQTGLRFTQSRAMAWSGVQAVMSQLSVQRDDLLQGKAPTLTEYWTVPSEEGEGATRWGFRVLRVRAGDGGDRVGAWVSCEGEMGKIDVNSAPKEILVKLPGITESLAGAIITARNQRPFTSVAELLRVPGVTAAMLFEGGVEPTTSSPGEDAGESKDDATEDDMPAAAARERSADRTGPDGASSERPTSSTSLLHTESASSDRRPLCEFVTVFSFDPEVQLGFGPKASEAKGNQRINLNTEWSDELGSAIERRFDRSVADGVKNLLNSGRTFKKPSDIVKTLRSFQIKPESWVEVLDAFTTSEEEYRFGQVDLGAASETVLACIPGITATSAKEIVFRRARLDEERRRTAVWPVLEGILTEDEFEKAADFITARCLQWRVVVEGGVVPAQDETAWDESEGSGGRWEGSSTAGAGALSASEFARRVDRRAAPQTKDRVVLEAVIDVSSQRPRVAMLRDVTHLALAKRLAGDIKASEPTDEPADPAATTPAASAGGSSTTREAASAAHDLDLGGLELDDLEMPETSPPPDISSTSPEPSVNDTNRTSSPPPPPSPRPPVDRRVGRWTAGGQGGKQ
jgi:hypothetical protein